MAVRKRFGQHFLASPGILARIVAGLAPAPEDRVLEIGPGRGVLTAALLATGASVAAIEIDRDLARQLRDRFPDLTLLEGDALEADWSEVVGAPAGGYLLVGNLPYNITSPLLEKALTPPLPARAVFLVQKEVADRIVAQPGTRAYGALTVGIGAAATVERLVVVPPGAFRPPPKVDSALILLTPRSAPLIAPTEGRRFRRVVTGIFSFRRKQLHRALRELTGWDPPRVDLALERAGADPTIRAERLAVPEFVRLYHALVDGGHQIG